MKSIITFMVAFVLLLAFNSSPLLCADQSFNVSLSLSTGITIQKRQDLIFPDQTITGSNYNVTVAPADAGAAQFDAMGRGNRWFTRSVVENNIQMSAPGVTGTIRVSNFTVSGPNRFDNTWHAYGLRVGARARVRSTSQDGDYAGTATFRVVYN